MKRLIKDDDDDGQWSSMKGEGVENQQKEVYFQSFNIQGKFILHKVFGRRLEDKRIWFWWLFYDTSSALVFLPYLSFFIFYGKSLRLVWLFACLSMECTEENDGRDDFVLKTNSKIMPKKHIILTISDEPPLFQFSAGKVLETKGNKEAGGPLLLFYSN